MDKFLEKIQSDLENKILSSANGESIVKPFNQVFKKVREIKNQNIDKESNKKNKQNIYDEIIREFLKKHPEFIKEE